MSFLVEDESTHEDTAPFFAALSIHEEVKCTNEGTQHRAATLRDARLEKFRAKQERAAARAASSPQKLEEQPPWLRAVEGASDASLDVFRDLKVRVASASRGAKIVLNKLAAPPAELAGREPRHAEGAVHSRGAGDYHAAAEEPGPGAHAHIHSLGTPPLQTSREGTGVLVETPQ